MKLEFELERKGDEMEETMKARDGIRRSGMRMRWCRLGAKCKTLLDVDADVGHVLPSWLSVGGRSKHFVLLLTQSAYSMML